MRIILGGLAFLVAGMLAIAVFGPRLLDDDALRARAETMIEAAAGRDVAIDGNLDIRLLPRPALSIARMRIGTGSALALDVDRLDLDVELLPLLAGDLSITRARLVRPSLRHAGSAGDAASGLIAMLDRGIDQPALEEIEIVAGTASLEGSEIADIAGAFRRNPLTGRLELDLAGTTGGRPIALAARLSGGEERIGLELALAPEGEDALDEIALRGAIHLADPALPAFAGRIALESGNAEATMQRLRALPWLDALPDLPVRLDGALQLAGRIEIAPARLALAETRFRLADRPGEIGLELRLGDAPYLALDIEAQTLALDTAAPLPLDPGQWLPPEMTGRIDIEIGALDWRALALRRAKLALALEGGGKVIVEDARAMLPGPGDVALDGEMILAAAGSRFEGRIGAAGEDLRGILEAIGIEGIDALPADRLRRFSLDGALALAPGHVSLRQAELRLDHSHIAGGMALRTGARPQLALSAAIDRLAFEALPKAADLPESWRALAGRVDAAIDVKIERLVLAGLRLADARLDLRRERDAIALRELFIGDSGGNTASLSGGIDLAAGTIDLQPAITIGSLSRLLRMAGQRPPATISLVGPILASGHIAGRMDAPALDLMVDGEGFKGHVGGSIAAPLDAPSFDLRASFAAPALPPLLDQLGAAALATLLPEEALELSLSLAGDGPVLEVALDGRLGEKAIAASLAHGPDAPSRLRLELDSLDPALVDAGWRWLASQGELIDAPPSAWPGAWPATPLRWDGLKRQPFELEIALRQPGPGSILLRNDGNRLELARLDLPLAGGRLAGTAALTMNDASSRLGMDIGLEDALARDLLELLGVTVAGDLAGRVSLDLALNAEGRSLADLARTARGSAALRAPEGGGALAIEAGMASPASGGLALAGGRLEGRFDLVAWLLDARLLDADGRPRWRLLGQPKALRLPPREQPSPTAPASARDEPPRRTAPR